MELKALQDWVVMKELKSVPDMADVSIFGGITASTRSRWIPNKLVSYGLSIGPGRAGAGGQ